jgi:hypothetical protein
MPDEFDLELDQAPEGSIITPIFLGCGAMGLGCVFSLGAILIGLMLFVPGLWNTIAAFRGDPMIDEALPLIEANAAVTDAIGTPIEAELTDVEEGPGAEQVEYEIGDDLILTVFYDLTGPGGTAQLEAVGSRPITASGEWTISSLVVTLNGGEEVQVFPEGDTVPTPPLPPEPIATESDGDSATGEPETGASEGPTEPADDAAADETEPADAPAGEESQN